MHFQVIKDHYFNNILNLLKEKVPEFESSFDEEDGVYPILGEFYRFILDNYENKQVAIKCFGFINDALEKGGNETKDAIVFQIFHPLFNNNEQFLNEARSYLTEKSKFIFDDSYNSYISFNNNIIKTIGSILHSGGLFGLSTVMEYNDLSIQIFKALEEGKSKEQLIDFVDQYLKKEKNINAVNKVELNNCINKIIIEFDKFNNTRE